MDWRYNTIWFEQIDDEKVVIIDCEKEAPANFEKLEYVTLWHYKQTNRCLDKIPASNEVRYLELNLGGTSSFTGIGRLSVLRRLELYYCRRLDTDSGLSEVAETLKHLHISHSRKFVADKELFKLRELEVLRLNYCGDIENLDFIHLFPKLIDFRFVGTKIISGDLSPLLEHENLKTVGFEGKQRYNLKPDKVQELLDEKWPDPYLIYVHKDEFSTFRHLNAEC